MTVCSPNRNHASPGEKRVFIFFTREQGRRCAPTHRAESPIQLKTLFIIWIHQTSMLIGYLEKFEAV